MWETKLFKKHREKRIKPNYLNKFPQFKSISENKS